jgi:hypothetical protein
METLDPIIEFEFDAIVEEPQEITQEDTRIAEEQKAEVQSNEDKQKETQSGGEQKADETPETPFAILAKELKGKGNIIDEIEITNDYDFNKLEEAIVKSATKKSEDFYRQKIYEELKEEGITAEVIQGVKLQSAGITNEDLGRLKWLGDMAMIEIDKLPEEIRESELMAWTTIRYLDLGYKDTHAKTAASEEIDNNPKAAEKANKEHFLNQYQHKDSEVKSKEHAAAQAKEIKRKEEKDQMLSLIESGKIAGEEFSKNDIEKLKKAFFEQTEHVKVGNKYMKMTLLQKKQMEERSSKELQILKAAQLVLGITPKKAEQKGKEKGQEEAAERFLKAQASSGSSKAPSAAKANTKSDPIFLEFDQGSF